jgi:hypothetical protein
MLLDKIGSVEWQDSSLEAAKTRLEERTSLHPEQSEHDFGWFDRLHR